MTTSSAAPPGKGGDYYPLFRRSLQSGGLHGGIFVEEAAMAFLVQMEKAGYKILSEIHDLLVTNGITPSDDAEKYISFLNNALDICLQVYVTSKSALEKETDRITSLHPKIVDYYKLSCVIMVREMYKQLEGGSRLEINVPPFQQFVLAFFQSLMSNPFVRCGSYFEPSKMFERRVLHMDAVRVALDDCVRSNVSVTAEASSRGSSTHVQPIDTPSTGSPSASTVATPGVAPATPSGLAGAPAATNPTNGDVPPVRTPPRPAYLTPPSDPGFDPRAALQFSPGGQSAKELPTTRATQRPPSPPPGGALVFERRESGQVADAGPCPPPATLRAQQGQDEGDGHAEVSRGAWREVECEQEDEGGEHVDDDDEDDAQDAFDGRVRHPSDGAAFCHYREQDRHTDEHHPQAMGRPEGTPSVKVVTISGVRPGTAGGPGSSRRAERAACDTDAVRLRDGEDGGSPMDDSDVIPPTPHRRQSACLPPRVVPRGRYDDGFPFAAFPPSRQRGEGGQQRGPLDPAPSVGGRERPVPNGAPRDAGFRLAPPAFAERAPSPPWAVPAVRKESAHILDDTPTGAGPFVPTIQPERLALDRGSGGKPQKE